MKISERSEKILDLAIPATVESILQTLVGFIDTLMIARIGLLAVTAVGISNNILAVYLAVFIALSVGTSSLVARYLGAGDKASARNIAIQSTGLSLLTGIVFGVATLLFARPLLQIMGAEADVVSAAMPFFLIVGGTSVFMSLLSTFGSILRATGDAKTPMAVNTAVNILNVLIDYVLIFGLGPIPALGILGTAIGTMTARIIGSVLMFRRIGRTELAFRPSEIFLRSNDRELVGLSIPAAMERLVMRLGQVLYFGLIVSMGVKTYAAHTIAGNIESFTYMPAFGLATAASVLAGNSIGRGNKREAYEYGMGAVRIGAGVMALGGIVLFIGASWFASWFTKEPDAIAKIVTALRIDTFAQVPLAFSLILAGALQGIGDTKSPLYSTMIGMWGIRVVGVYLLGIGLRMDIAGVWLSILLDLTIRAIFLTLRFRARTIKALCGEKTVPVPLE